MIVGGVLHGVWEMAHSPLYSDYARSWFYLLWTRIHCTIGDVLILLIAFWVTSCIVGNRRWIKQFKWIPLTIFTLSGMVYTAYSEWYNVYVRESWAYTEAMPKVFGVGLTPLLQWGVLPLLIAVILSYRNTTGNDEGRTQTEVRNHAG